MRLPDEPEFWDRDEHIQNASDILVESLCMQYLELCKQEIAGDQQKDRSRTLSLFTAFESLPKQAVHLAMAVLHVCLENPPSDRTRSILMECEQMASKTGAIDWIEALPWNLCRQLPRANVFHLTANLDHSNSSIRLRLMNYAWLMRDRLDPEKTAAPLFTNLSDKLGYLAETAALCRALYGTDEAFFEAADAFKPISQWEQQFRFRIAKLREIGFIDGTTSFQSMESILWRHCLPRLKNIKIKQYIFSSNPADEIDFRTIPLDKIAADPVTAPLLDEKFVELLKGSWSGSVPFYRALIPLNLIETFDPAYDPRDWPDLAAAVIKDCQDILNGRMPFLLVYPCDDLYCLSDHYVGLTAVRILKLEQAYSWVLGYPSIPGATDIQGPLPLNEVRSMYGLDN